MNKIIFLNTSDVAHSVVMLKFRVADELMSNLWDVTDKLIWILSDHLRLEELAVNSKGYKCTMVH